jgi:hypothetical protein
MQDVMEKPVFLSDGHTYEEAAIKVWLRSGKRVRLLPDIPKAGNGLAAVFLFPVHPVPLFQSCRHCFKAVATVSFQITQLLLMKPRCGW